MGLIYLCFQAIRILQHSYVSRDSFLYPYDTLICFIIIASLSCMIFPFLISLFLHVAEDRKYKLSWEEYYSLLRSELALLVVSIFSIGIVALVSLLAFLFLSWVIVGIIGFSFPLKTEAMMTNILMTVFCQTVAWGWFSVNAFFLQILFVVADRKEDLRYACAGAFALVSPYKLLFLKCQLGIALFELVVLYVLRIVLPYLIFLPLSVFKKHIIEGISHMIWFFIFLVISVQLYKLLKKQSTTQNKVTESV